MGQSNSKDKTAFEKWFLGSRSYSDDALRKNEDGEYYFSITQVFHECWEESRKQYKEELK